MWICGSPGACGVSGFPTAATFPVAACFVPAAAVACADDGGGAAGTSGTDFRRLRALKTSRRYVPSSISCIVLVQRRSYVAAVACNDWIRNESAEFREGIVLSAAIRFLNCSWALLGARFSMPRKYCSYCPRSACSSASTESTSWETCAQLAAVAAALAFARSSGRDGGGIGHLRIPSHPRPAQVAPGGPCAFTWASGRLGAGGGRQLSARRGPPDQERHPEREHHQRDELAGGDVPPGVQRHLLDELVQGAPLEIAPEQLDRRPDDGVADEVQGEDLSVEASVLPRDHQQHEQQQLRQRLVELGGVDGQRGPVLRDPVRDLDRPGHRVIEHLTRRLDDPAVHLLRLAVPGDGPSGVLAEEPQRTTRARESHRPGQVERGRLPPAASRREASQPAEGLPQSDRGDDDVGEPQEGDPPCPAEPPHGERRSDQPAVEDEAPAEGTEHLPQAAAPE